MSGHGYGFGFGVQVPVGLGEGAAPAFSPGDIGGIDVWFRPEENTNPNLLTQTEALLHLDWSESGTTNRAADAALDPNGGSGTFIFSATSAWAHIIRATSIDVADGVDVVLSVYVKQGPGYVNASQRIRIEDGVGQSEKAVIIPTTSWVRHEITHEVSAAATGLTARIYPDEGGTAGGEVLIALPQLELGTTATTYVESTTAPGGQLALWADQSAAGNDATQSTAGNKPLVQAAALDGYSAVRFDGVATHLDLDSAITSTGAAEIWAVVLPENGAVAKALLGQHDGTADVWAINSTEDLILQEGGAASVVTSAEVTIDSPQLVRIRRDASDVLFGAVNGQDHSIAAVSNAGDIVVRRLGGVQAAWPFSGLIVELLHFSAAVSTNDAYKLNNYFQDRYGTTISELIVLPETESPLAAYGTLVSHINPTAYLLDGSSKVLWTPELSQSTDAVTCQWESDTSANRPLIDAAFVNSLDVFDFETGDALHVTSPLNFKSPGPADMDIAGDFTAFATFWMTTVGGSNFELFNEDYSSAETSVFVGTGGNVHWWDGAQIDLATNGDIAGSTWYVMCIRRDSLDNLYCYINAVDKTTGSPNKSAVFTPQMIKAGSNNYKLLDWAVFSDDIGLTNINAVGQALADRAGLTQTWSLS